jgi:large subunit ribosomal protein L19
MAIKAVHQQTSFQVGDTVKVHHKFQVNDKTQTQVFEGVVIAIKGRGVSKTFTVRKIAADAIGVEKIWPLHNPNLIKIEVKRRGKVRRAKLYYLRERIGKGALKVNPAKPKTAKTKPPVKKAKSS